MRQIEKIERHPVIALLVVCVPVLALALGSAVFSAYMEARAFNRATGKNISTWDAMFIQLRVQEGMEE